MAETLYAQIRKLQGATDDELASEQRVIHRRIDARERARQAALAADERAHAPVIPDGYALVSSRYLTALEAIAERDHTLAANQRSPIAPDGPADAADPGDPGPGRSAEMGSATARPTPPTQDRRVVEI